VKEFNNKFQVLKEAIQKMNSILIAYSGGVDSTFLLKVAFDVLGQNAVGVIAKSPTYPLREYENALKTARIIGAKVIEISTDELKSSEFAANSPNRCYYCKKELFLKLRKIAKDLGLSYVADGSNADDQNDFRPGHLASRELQVKSPLNEAHLTKKEIRELSRKIGLPTWKKPSMACLASRIPYGETITEEKLQAISDAEYYLQKQGLSQIRVRCHGAIARIEVEPEEFIRFSDNGFRNKVINHIKKCGFTYIVIDLQGYRTGSMNEVLEPKITSLKETHHLSRRESNNQRCH
jgi:uncharacterized protein